MGVIETPAMKKTTVVKMFLAFAMFVMFVLFTANALPRREEGEGVLEHMVEEAEEAVGLVENDDADEMEPSPGPEEPEAPEERLMRD